jgi:hypothetical protein
VKNYLLIGLLMFSLITNAQSNISPNIFIITTDGFRWQEVFGGADPQLLSNPNLVADTAACNQMFGGTDPLERRKKLLPFFWQVIARKGQLAGNRQLNNKVNVANLYKISYPGYQEMLTGRAPAGLNPNWAINSKMPTVLETANQKDVYKGKVVAFCSWNILPYILREKESGIPVNAGYEAVTEENDQMGTIINRVQSTLPIEHTRNDLLTFVAAKNYLQQSHPKIMFLGLGETDEYAHRGNYDQYLMKAHQFDQLLADLWYFVQNDPFYKNNTTFIITTDHGRGSRPQKWGTHGFWVKGSGEIWTAMIGPDVQAYGELKFNQTTYLKQIAGKVNQLIDTTPAVSNSIVTTKNYNVNTGASETFAGTASDQK